MASQKTEHALIVNRGGSNVTSLGFELRSREGGAGGGDSFTWSPRQFRREERLKGHVPPQQSLCTHGVGTQAASGQDISERCGGKYRASVSPPVLNISYTCTLKAPRMIVARRPLARNDTHTCTAVARGPVATSDERRGSSLQQHPADTFTVDRSR